MNVSTTPTQLKKSFDTIDGLIAKITQYTGAKSAAAARALLQLRLNGFSVMQIENGGKGKDKGKFIATVNSDWAALKIQGKLNEAGEIELSR